MRWSVADRQQTNSTHNVESLTANYVLPLFLTDIYILLFQNIQNISKNSSQDQER